MSRRGSALDSEAVKASVIPAELAITAVTVASVAGLTRLFSDTAFLAPVVSAALLAHSIAWLARSRKFSPAPALGISLAGLGVFIIEVLQAHTTWYGIPSRATFGTIASLLSTGWKEFGTVVAPTPTTPGFVLAAVIAIWLGATVSDVFAFRARTRFEALVPSFTAFLFGALLGADRQRVTLSATYLACVLLFLILTERIPVGGGLTPTTAPSWRAVALIGAVAIFAAAVVGPRLPGADQPELVAWRDRGPASGARVTVSPLVDIRGRLIDLSETELFTVRSNREAYWRLTSLDLFDGAIWSSRGGYRQARRTLPGSPASPTSVEVRQDITIGGLSSVWLPAAFRPSTIDVSPKTTSAPRVSFDPISASLVTSGASPGGLRYSVLSAVPRFTTDQLMAVATGATPSAIAKSNLALPANFPTEVVRLAREVVAGQSGPYRQARALQDWFRREFKYNLDVAPGHGIDAISRFLFETKEGYCEQFAGSFAAMARSLGLPTRVAVGFTPGTIDADGTYRIRAKNAHAWPEVYLGTAGWVAFEPTPGRGMAGAQDYSGVAPPPTPRAGEPEVDAGTQAEDPVPPAGAGQDSVPASPSPSTPATEPGSTPADSADPSTESMAIEGNRPSPVTILGIVLTGVATGLAGIYVARRRGRASRRAAAGTPSERVLVAWAEATETMAAAGLGPRAWETPTEYARRGGVALAAANDALSTLATAVSMASYRRDQVEVGLATVAIESSESIVRTVATTQGAIRWALWSVDPRPLWRSRTNEK